jgi:hypothetical protein
VFIWIKLIKKIEKSIMPIKFIENSKNIVSDRDPRYNTYKNSNYCGISKQEKWLIKQRERFVTDVSNGKYYCIDDPRKRIFRINRNISKIRNVPNFTSHTKKNCSNRYHYPQNKNNFNKKKSNPISFKKNLNESNDQMMKLALENLKRCGNPYVCKKDGNENYKYVSNTYHLDDNNNNECTLKTNNALKLKKNNQNNNFCKTSFTTNTLKCNSKPINNFNESKKDIKQLLSKNSLFDIKNNDIISNNNNLLRIYVD